MAMCKVWQFVAIGFLVAVAVGVVSVNNCVRDTARPSRTSKVGTESEMSVSAPGNSGILENEPSALDTFEELKQWLKEISARGSGILQDVLDTFQKNGLVFLDTLNELVKQKMKEASAKESGKVRIIQDDMETTQEENLIFLDVFKEFMKEKIKGLVKMRDVGPDEYLYLRNTIIPAMREAVLSVRRTMKAYDREVAARYMRESIEETIKWVKENRDLMVQHLIWYLVLVWAVAHHFLLVMCVHRWFLNE